MKRIAVIGAGAAGLVAAKHSFTEEFDVTVYEQESDLGGIWNFSSNPSAHSALYEEIISNMPKQLMEFENFPYDDDIPTFLTGKNILDYLRRFADGIKIEYETKAIQIEKDGMEKWKITTETSTRKISSSSFDVVFICNGHFREPNNVFETSNFHGRFLHSHDYRRSSDFKNEIVAVVGTSYSGIDIALQMSSVAKKIYFIGRKDWKNLPENVEYVAGLLKGITSDGVTLDNGRQINGLDSIIDCTGYRFSYPFLSEEIVQVKEMGKLVDPLWMFLIHKEYPTSLFFIGLNDISITFLFYEQQVKFALSLISKRVEVPKEDLEKWNEERKRALEEQQLPLSSFQNIPLEQYDYMRLMAKFGDFPEVKHLETIKHMNEFVEDCRNQNPNGYKNMRIVMDGDSYQAVL